jgi:hypothetical protein
LLASLRVPESRDPTARGRLDFGGAALAALGLAGTTYALIEAPGGLGSGLVLVTGIGGVLALIAFLLSERRSANPMMSLEIFSSRQFSAANAVTFVVYAALGGVFFLLVAFLQISLGYSPIAACAASLPITILMLLLSARSGALAQRIGARIPLTVGPLVIAAGGTVGLGGNTRRFHYGMGLVVEGGWIVENPSLAGFAVEVAYLPAKKLTIAVVSTKGQRSEVDPNYSELITRHIAGYLAPKHPIPLP